MDESRTSTNSAAGRRSPAPHVASNPSSLLTQDYPRTTRTGMGFVASPAGPSRSGSETDDFFSLERHLHSTIPAILSSTPRRSSSVSSGLFRHSDQFDVDQSVNFMDHSLGIYSLQPRKTHTKRESRSQRQTSFVDIFLSMRQKRDSDLSTVRMTKTSTDDTVPKENEKKAWPKIAAYILIFLTFAVCAAFLAVSVPHLVRAPPSEEEQQHRYDSIQASLVAKGLSQAQDFQNQTSIQHSALQWLSRTDPAQLQPDDPRLPSRYALAVFFYANHPDIAAEHGKGRRRLQAKWTNQGKWMTSADVCQWYGVECDVIRDSHKDIVGWNMTANALRGVIPSEIQALSNLVLLDLSMNQLSGTISETLYQFPAIKYLILRGNALTGTISDHIGHLNSAENIDLSNNLLRGGLPKSINTCVNLRQLSLASNDITGTIPDISQLTLLASLNLNQNKLEGKLPSSLTTLSSLSYLSIEENSLYGSLPFTLNALSSLDYLLLAHNHFNGGIPDVFEGFHNLTEIRLQKNLLQHKLPPSMGSLKNLKRIVMDSNRLIGSMPPEWMNLTQLEALILHDNELTGSISAGIRHLVHLKDFWLNKNKMTGVLPTQLGRLRDLNTLYLQENVFSGTPPTEIGMLQDLQALRLENNELVGVVPTEVCALKGKDELQFLSATCSDLRCVCCDKCS